MDDKDAGKILKKYERLLFSNKNNMPVELTLDWVRKFPIEPGVYAFFKQDELVYIGETGSIQGRMNDVRSTRNHTLRRNIGTKRFSKHKHYKEASSTNKFPDNIESLVDKYMKKMSVSVVPINIGRTEFEEYMTDKYEIDYNKKLKRKG